jgi:hypothetical protein
LNVVSAGSSRHAATTRQAMLADLAARERTVGPGEPFAISSG